MVWCGVVCWHGVLSRHVLGGLAMAFGWLAWGSANDGVLTASRSTVPKHRACWSGRLLCVLPCLPHPCLCLCRCGSHCCCPHVCSLEAPQGAPQARLTSAQLSSSPSSCPAPPRRFVQLYCSMGFFPCYSPLLMLPAIAAVCATCTVVESLPVNSVLDDNLTVPLVAALMSMALMPLMAAAGASAGMEAAPAAAAAFGLLSG